MMRATKRLGQHFLRSPSVLKDIIAAADLSPNDTVLEIGPGTGVLTRALAARVKEVVAVEKDDSLVHSLGRNLEREGIRNVRLISGDILQIPLAELSLPAGYVIVANIPYYLTSRLVRTLLESARPPERMLLMVQKEVAERMCARPPHMNLLALSVQAYAAPEFLFAIPPSAFNPPPKIDSALVRIADISKRFFSENRISEEEFFALVRQAFQHKRKQLASSLSASYPRSAVTRALAAMDAPPTARPQELEIKRWVLLLRSLRTEANA